MISITILSNDCLFEEKTTLAVADEAGVGPESVSLLLSAGAAPRVNNMI